MQESQGPGAWCQGEQRGDARGGVGVAAAAGLVVRVGVDLVWRVYIVDGDSFRRSLEWRLVGVRN